MNVQIPHGIEKDGVVFRPVVEGGAQRGVQQGFPIGRGLPAAECRALTDLHPGENKAVVETFVMGHQALLHHDQIEIPPAVKDLLHGHLSAAVLRCKAVGQLVGCHPQRMVGGHRLEPGSHRVFPVGRVTGIEHDIGCAQHIGRQSTGNTRKIVDNGIGAVLLQRRQDRFQIGFRFLQEQKRHRSSHIGLVLPGFTGMALHPGGHRHEPGARRFHNGAETLGAEIGHPHAPAHQFGDQFKGWVNMTKGSQRNNGNMHDRQLLPNSRCLPFDFSIQRPAVGLVSCGERRFQKEATCQKSTYEFVGFVKKSRRPSWNLLTKMDFQRYSFPY